MQVPDNLLAEGKRHETSHEPAAACFALSLGLFEEMRMINRKPIRVLCADDNAALIDGLQIKLAVEQDFECVGRVLCTDDLLNEVVESQPDIVLLDIDMPGRESIEVLADVVTKFPDVRVVILSGHVRADYINRALDAGAWGYVAKSEEPDVIVASLRGVARGELAFGLEVTQHLRQSWNS
jgi:two-component system response regulator DegU